MRRHKTEELIHWKQSKQRKPIIIQGARQTGKTWLMKDFGKSFYKKTVYINFEKAFHLKALFTNGIDINRILLALQAESGIIIDPVDTLIIFDEIQAVPEAITSLKYFCEDFPDYNIIAAGSLLGISIHSKISFPVGKVQFMKLYPMNFFEFIDALDEKALIEVLNSCDMKLISIFKTKLIERLKQYYFVGGMPEAVSVFALSGNFTEVRKIHKHILNAYEMDFSKHAPIAIVPRIRMIWNSVLSQLTKENKKFIYGLIKAGARAKEFEIAISWLVDNGLLHKINRISKPHLPLKAYEDIHIFKLFFLDTGLLTAMGNMDAKTVMYKNKIFTEFKGALTEQFVLQELISMENENTSISYWAAERAMAELDFVIQYKDTVYPIEVKAEENLKAKSLKVFQEKYSIDISIRISMSDFRKEEKLINVPLYMIPILFKIPEIEKTQN